MVERGGSESLREPPSVEVTPQVEVAPPVER